MPAEPLSKSIALDKINAYLAKGCDERIYLGENGLNRYWIDPSKYHDLVHRGSCTCGTLNDENVRLMDELLQDDLEDRTIYERLLEEQTKELKGYINYQGENLFEVFYAPSGSDLAYYPILFGMIMHPERPVLNIVSCPEELGSGTLHAVKGEYHAEFNQFEEMVEKAGRISPDMDVEVLFLNARGLDGKIINHETYIKDQVDKHPDHSIIVSLVYGSKSGIEDNLDLIDKIDRDDIIWSVDMCQFRHSRKIIHRLLDKNACIMITGSKFYQAPPFCGAMLVSHQMMEDLARGDIRKFSLLDRVLSGYDIPAVFRKGTGLPMRKNVGLRLRWACSLNEMKHFREIPRSDALEKISAWNSFVMGKLEASPDFEPMPDQGMTNNTIISFRVKKEGRYLDHKELKELYRLVVSEGRMSGPEQKRIFIGQPVAYGQKSFLRVAIGSMCIREFIATGETAFTEDAEILDIIASKIPSING
jgi:hypothetical protein